MKHKISIVESPKEDINLVINSPAALKHLSASTEDGGRVLRQIFSFLSTLGHRFYVASMWNGAWMRYAHSYKCCCYALCSCLHHKTCFDVLKVANSK